MKKKRKIAKKDKYPSALAKTLVEGANRLLNLVIDMEKKGVSEVMEEKEYTGKTKDGRDFKLKYGYGVKIGLDDLIKKAKAKKK